ncbi:MAG: hypothetical protein WCP35_11690 [Verrucomicrobiota bacterium]
MKLLVYIIAITALSCSRRGTTPGNFQSAGGVETVQVDRTGKVPKVNLVTKIEPLLSNAITEHWGRDMWISKVGQPLRIRNLGEGVELMEYVETGPFEPCGEKLISGVIIVLKDGATMKYEWHYTTFGLPDNMEIDKDGHVKPRVK